MTPRKTSTLARSINHRVEKSGERGIVGTNVNYARFVHDGTSKMAGRPYFQWALAASRDSIDQLM